MFPVRLFLLLAYKEHAADILGMPRCVRGEWANQFIRKHPGLDSDECFFQLTIIALLWPTDIGMTESRHASIRRALESRSLQTHRLQFKHLSAEWTLQQSRLGARAVDGGLGRAPKYGRKAAGGSAVARYASGRCGQQARKDAAQSRMRHAWIASMHRHRCVFLNTHPRNTRSKLNMYVDIVRAACFR